MFCEKVVRKGDGRDEVYDVGEVLEADMNLNLPHPTPQAPWVQVGDIPAETDQTGTCQTWFCGGPFAVQGPKVDGSYDTQHVK
jgi:hypothetical protein